MEKVIKSIESIKGVNEVVIDQLKDNTLIVRVEPEHVAVECTNSEQWNFTTTRCNGESWIKEYETRINAVNIKTGRFSSKSYYEEEGFTVISFQDYLTDYNLTDEWEKYLIGEAVKRYPVGTKFTHAGYLRCCEIVSDGSFSSNFSSDYPDGIKHDSNGMVYCNGKWAEIVKNELVLVEGEIYYDSKNFGIFRFSTGEGSTINSHSTYFTDNKLFDCTDNPYSMAHNDVDIKPATDKQKRKLIKAEFKNKFYWELESKKK